MFLNIFNFLSCNHEYIDNHLVEDGERVHVMKKCIHCGKEKFKGTLYKDDASLEQIKEENLIFEVVSKPQEFSEDVWR